jgi:hypothetical protein
MGGKDLEETVVVFGQRYEGSRIKIITWGSKAKTALRASARGYCSHVWVGFWTGLQNGQCRVWEGRLSVSSLGESAFDITALGLVDTYMPDDITIDLPVQHVPKSRPGVQYILLKSYDR